MESKLTTTESTPGSPVGISYADWTEQLEDKRRDFERINVEFANTTISDIDKWLISISGIGLSAAFAGIITGQIDPEYTRSLRLVIVFLCLSLVVSLASKSVAYIAAVRRVSEIRDAEKYDPDRKLVFLQQFRFHGADRAVVTLNFVGLSLIAMSVLAIILAVFC